MSDTKRHVTIYTDGGCKPNPGPGGWGALLLFPDSERELSGYAEQTTNNQMELTAAIAALEALPQRSHVELYTDSTYLKNGITRWIANWKRKDWRTASGSPVKNQDLWQRLSDAIDRHEIKWRWVRGHAGNEYNERVDRLATAARAEITGEAIEPEKGTAEQRTDIAAYLNGYYVKGERVSGWGAVIVEKGEAQSFGGAVNGHSDNHVRLLGAIALLQQLTDYDALDIYTDSEYIQKGVTQWVSGWIKTGWKTRSGSPVKYQELWKQLHQLNQQRIIHWHYAPGNHELIQHARKIAQEQTTN